MSCEHVCLFNFYCIVQVQQLREVSNNGMKITEWWQNIIFICSFVSIMKCKCDDLVVVNFVNIKHEELITPLFQSEKREKRKIFLICSKGANCSEYIILFNVEHKINFMSWCRIPSEKSFYHRKIVFRYEIDSFRRKQNYVLSVQLNCKL